uniref:Receptor expression-enhancing protein n=1 Tax=Gongylonema pulchrum TaxID=637853 RepID=A0A183D2W1_9BILA
LVFQIHFSFFSINAIESSRKDDDSQWLTYWVVFALLTILEFFSETFVAYIPVYWLVKCLFLVWLFAPMTMGAQKIYARIIQPFVHKHHSLIGKQIGRAAQKLNEGGDGEFSKFPHNFW